MIRNSQPRRRLCPITLSLTLIAFALCSAPAAAQEFVAFGNVRAFPQAPGVHETVFRAAVGLSPFDRIALHRYLRNSPSSAHPSIEMLYLPGTNMNGEAANDDPRYSLILYLAKHGVGVWALDYRTHFVPPETPADQLTELKGWTNELFGADIDVAAKYVLAQSGRQRIFVAGFSRGVSFAYAYAASHPDHVQGLLLLDGPIVSDRSNSPPPEPGVYATDVSGKHLTWDKRQALLAMVIKNPDGPAPIPAFKTAGDNLAHVVYSSSGFGGAGGLANPVSGFSNLPALARLLITYDRYWPTIQDYEDSDGPMLHALTGTNIPVLAFSSTNISPQWAQRVADSAATAGSSSVTVRKLQGWGHLDILCGTHAEQDVYAPVLRWLRQHQK
jgi:pimeloyl-ACP methyl ester carboxylesterase